MARNRVGGHRTAVVLAVVGASLTGGIVNYSIAVAAPSASPEIFDAAAPQGLEVPCEWQELDLDWYRQRGDQMQSGEMLPNTVSFLSPAAAVQTSGLKPTGENPCGGGGGGGGTSCLSTFGFDPDNYWAVLSTTDGGASSANVYAAPINSLTALTDSDIPTTTGCTVTYEWTFSEADIPFAGIIDYWNSIGGTTSVTGPTSTSMTISGLDFNQQWSLGGIYNLYLCGGNLALRVSDGVNDYDIKAPACSYYRFETITYSTGVGFEFEYKDPWNRDESIDRAPDYLGPGGGLFLNFATIPTVKPSSPLTVKFKVTALYTLRTGLDSAVNCADASVNTTIFNATSQTAASTWIDPSPLTERIYCLDEIPS
ncbi:MAG: hypothetical protein ACKOI2_13950 [Actinomycetota bacterium]